VNPFPQGLHKQNLPVDHGIFPSCQESEELSTSFFSRRPRNVKFI